MKNVLKKLLPKNIKLFIIEHRYMFKVIKSKYKKKLNNLFNDNISQSLNIDDKNKWINKLIKLAYSNLKYTSLGIEFMKSEISILKEIEILEDDIVLICVEKNDLIKLKEFINHHRKIGIDKFIILDNDSDDGTVDYLLKQEDVFLLQTKIPYTFVRRTAWINRIIAHFGDNRWYIVLDSDELLVYNDYENKSIKDFIKYSENNNKVRGRALMLEMYAKDEYYVNGKQEDFLKECIYFDADTYHFENREQFIKVTGGVRNRVFNISTCLTKYPIFYFRKKDIFCNSHFLYPYKDNFNNECFFVVRHYKFLPGEIEKYRKIAKDENYYNGSKAYKKIINVIDKKKNISFMSDNSYKYENSTSLDKISLYNKINWR